MNANSHKRKMIFLIFNLIFLISIANCQTEIGEECEKNGVKGVCMMEHDCTQLDLSNLGKTALKHKCSWANNGKMVICCPPAQSNETAPETTTIRPTARFLSDSENSENSKTYCSRSEKTFDSISDRIQGGERTISKVPFIAALSYDRDGHSSFLCGGALISKKYVLTAARE